MTANPRNLTAMGRLGTIAARTQGRAAAQLWDSLLGEYTVQYSDKGRPTWWRADIALALGERDRALALFRQALNEGLNFWNGDHGSPFHVDVDLEPLFDPPYQELVEPKP